MTGDFDAAQKDFQAVAEMERDNKAKAEAHHNAYRAALERRDWPGAVQELVKAINLDPKRFAPFPTGKYQPVRILGAGGFGVAFLCKHKLMDDRVVIKTLLLDDLGRDADKVFTEAQVLRQLDHPAVIRISDCGYVDAAKKSRPFLVMDYFEGGTLEEQVKSHGPLPVPDLLAVARQVAEGLHAAHEKGILHRDVKPANLLVRQDGAVWKAKVIDFGLAQQQKVVQKSTNASTATRSKTLVGDSIAGTLDYGPPEQMGKRADPVGPYSDVYGWAKTCCFALFQTTQPTLRHWQSVPQPLAELLGRCLEDDPKARPQGFADVLTALDRLADAPAPESKVARPVDTDAEVFGPVTAKSARTKRPVKPSRRPLVIGGVVVAVLVVGIVVQSKQSRNREVAENTQPSDPVVPPIANPPKKTPKEKETPSEKSKETPKEKDSPVVKDVPPQPPMKPTLIRVPGLDGGGFPWLSRDGLTIFWETVGGEIWTARRGDGQAPFGTKRRMSTGRHPTLSADELELITVANRADGRPGYSIWAARRDGPDKTFGPPAEVRELLGQTGPRNPCLSADGLTLYFNRNAGTDQAEIVVATRKTADSPWGTPAPLPLAGKTGHLPTWPFVTADGLTLYCTDEKNAGQLTLMMWTRPSTDIAFGTPRSISVPGIPPLQGRSPRYVPATGELFFTKVVAKGEFEIWVVRGFHDIGATGLPAADEWTPLFNGKDLTNFYTYLGTVAEIGGAVKKDAKSYGKNNDPEGVFTVRDGVLRISGKVFGGLLTEKEYENYHLKVEYRWGDKTWPPRETTARDSGILLHCAWSEDEFRGWPHSYVECQMIEGGTGDLLPKGNGTQKLSVEAEQRDGQVYFKPGATLITQSRGRFNWLGRDPAWKDVKGFRGKQDVERPVGEWNTLECICERDKITVILNSTVVNVGTYDGRVKGNILIQSQGAEVLFRKIEVKDLTPAPTNPVVTVKTSLGDFKIELFEDKAPNIVGHFLNYVRDEWFDGTIFHKIVRGCDIQAGYTGQSKKPPGRLSKVDTNDLKNEPGTVNLGNEWGHFYINIGNNAGWRKDCVIGRVVEGMDVVKKISEVETTKVGGDTAMPVKPITIISIRREAGGR